jgi:hypothetical protein
MQAERPVVDTLSASLEGKTSSGAFSCPPPATVFTRHLRPRSTIALQRRYSRTRLCVKGLAWLLRRRRIFIADPASSGFGSGTSGRLAWR